MSTEIEKSSKFGILATLRSKVLNGLIVPVTSRWYRDVLNLLPSDVKMLDIGIGTAASLLANRDIVNRKNILVTGVDYCESYVEHAKRAVAESSIKDRVELVCGNIHDFNSDNEKTFDIVYFSGSFMIIPEPSKALRRTARMLESRKFKKDSREGNIFFTQTFERPSWLGRYVTPTVKRLLTALTTVDFGEVTFEEEFMATLERADVKVVDLKTIRSSYFRREVLVVARPKNC